LKNDGDYSDGVADKDCDLTGEASAYTEVFKDAGNTGTAFDDAADC